MAGSGASVCSRNDSRGIAIEQRHSCATICDRLRYA
jgi:hypothetical protein